MADLLEAWEFNAAWAIVFWLQAMFVPYGIWFNLPYTMLVKGIGFGLLLSVFGGLITSIEGHSLTDVVVLREVSKPGRVIVVGYAFVLACILIVLGKSALKLMRHIDKQPH